MDKMTSNTLALLRRGPVKAGGRLECEVANRLRLGSSSSNVEMVKTIILKLENDGVVVVDRSGSVLRSMALVPKPKIPTNEMKEVEVVKETQVVTSVATDATEEKISDQASVSQMDDTQEALYAQLSLALLALQTAADEDGVVRGPSTKLIMRELKISHARASSLNTLLGKLRLRETTGRRTSTAHQIDMTTKEVTREMVEALATAPAKATVEAEPVFVEPVLPAQTESSPLSVEEQLADVIERLDGEVERLQGELRRANEGLAEEMGRYDSAATESARVINGLSEDLQAANRTIADLRNQIAALQAPPSDRVKSILARHLPSTDVQE